MTTDELLRQAQSLDPSERLKLIHGLWDTLPTSQWPQPDEAELAEVQRRSAEIDSGAVQAVPWENVQERMRQRLNGDAN